ncbi:MAG: carboxypeptidase-like regulatory domain-containing protein [Planctomycetota bacterium]
MRSVLVLLLVIAAAGGLFFVLNRDGGKAPGSGPAIVGPATPEGPAVAPKVETEELVDVAPPTSLRKDIPEAVTPSAADTSLGKIRLDTGRGAVLGKVTGEGGAPIKDAEVRLTRYGMENLFFLDPGADRIPDITGKSEADGTFRLENVPVFDQYSLVVTHPKFSRYERSPVIVREGRTTEEPSVVLMPGVGLSGRVSDTGGNNVPGAVIRLNYSAFASFLGDASESVEATSDAEGRYAFMNLAAGNYSLSATADGYGRIDVQNINVDGKEAATKDIVLEVAHMIAGTVRTVDGVPLADVEVNAYSMDNRTTQSRSQVRTDEQGQFVIQDVPQGRYLIQAVHPSYEMVERQLRVETGDMSVQVLMRALPRVRGQVVAASSGQPVTSFTVQLRQPVPNSNPPATTAIPASRISVVDPEGRFELGAPKAGEYRVHVVAEGYADSLSPTFVITAGSDANNITVAAIKGGALRGRVIDSNGEPVVGARVTSHHKDWSDDLFAQSLAELGPWLATETAAVTNGEGVYVLKNLMPETYQVTVKHPDYAGAGQTGLLVSDGNETLAREIILPAGSTISGVVYGPNGRPLPGALVRLQPEGQFSGSTPGGPYTARADDAGRYEIRNVKQGSYGAYATRPASQGGNPFQESFDMKFTKKTLSVREGGTYESEDFKLRDQ